MLVVDGTDPDLLRGILETDLSCTEDRHKSVIGFWEKWAELGPAWGMIGTLVGLVNMLKKLDDPSTIGPQMAVALITTLYGSLVANWLCNPIASKLKINNDIEVVNRQITIEGLLSIQAGENPRVIEEKLKSFLAPSQRDALGGESGGEE
jgi:chemotaxis protein MotA